MERKNFLKAYSSVFDPMGEITACGRKRCLELLDTFGFIGQNPANFGDLKTGFLNISAINSFIFEEFPEIFFRQNFMKAYWRVFDKRGYIYTDDTNAYCSLIDFCHDATSKLVYYGNSETGWLYIPEIKSCVAKVYPEVIFREHYFRVFDDVGNIISRDEDEIMYLLLSIYQIRPDYHHTIPLVSRFDPVAVKALYKEIFPCI